tara:strand:+ start:4093 stop:5106 length:1014 start_codon:yes stop_codon:yes gene_type:complete
MGRDIKKIALGDQHGIFQHFQADSTDYSTRERYLSQRGHGSPDSDLLNRERLYGITSEKEASYVPTEHVAPHLSTRYSPDRIGVQAMRVPGSNGGVFQDPYTKKIYNYNEGFTSETGRVFPAGSAAFQTDLMSFAKKLNDLGLKKESAYVNALCDNSGSAPTSSKLVGDLVKIANHLDEAGLHSEANYLDQILKKRAGRLRNIADFLGVDTERWAQNEAASMPPEELASIALSLPDAKKKDVIEILFDDQGFREVAVASLDSSEILHMIAEVSPEVKMEVARAIASDPGMASDMARLAVESMSSNIGTPTGINPNTANPISSMTGALADVASEFLSN